MLNLLVFALALTPGLLAAEKIKTKIVAERPPVPSDCVDLELVGAGGPRPFFEKRAENAQCRTQLDAAFLEYETTRAKIEALKAERDPAAAADDAKLVAQNKQIDSLGADLKTKRAAILGFMQECGECATKDVTALTVMPKMGRGKEAWYETDGSCQIPSTETAVLEKAFSSISDSLVHAKRYPLYSPGGFANVLDFQVVDGLDFKSDVDAFPPSPLNLGVWVRGLKLPGFDFSLAFRYFIEAKYGTQNRGATKEFSLSFSTVEDPDVLRALKFPDDVKDRSPSGRPIEVIPKNLLNVRGLWCVNSEGYIRYYTAAEFPYQSPQLAKLGRDILLDTLIALSSRGQWKAAP